MRKRKYTDKIIIAALEANNALVTRAAEALHCSPQTIYTRIAESNDVKNVMKNGRLGLTDLAKEGLKIALEKREPWAIQFTLKTLGKEEGFVERQELKDIDDKKLEILVTHVTKPYPTSTNQLLSNK
jgi:hypothetical protein